MELAQLQVLTSYSLLASTNRIPELVRKGKEYGYQALAITDINGMHGVIAFYEECKRAGIKPLIGITLEYSAIHAQSKQIYRVILLAKDLIGYQNLMQISTLKLETPDSSEFDFDQFKDYLNNLIMITAGSYGELEQLVASGNIQEALLVLQTWQAYLPIEDIYAGLTINKDTSDWLSDWVKFIEQANLVPVALSDVRYLYPSDDFSLQVLRCIAGGTQLAVQQGESSGQYYLPRPELMAEKFDNAGFVRALTNTLQISQKCQLEIPLHQKLLPHFPVPVHKTSSSYLKELCYQNLALRVTDPSEQYRKRLDMELSVIHEMGFDDYFLIVWDVMDFAHRNQIVTGAGRGSAAGSLVSYVLQITDVDPIKYDLLFERFLNKERYTMPDIDLDIPDNRRDDVLHYVGKKYGHHHVAQIATFGTMAAKMVLRDVCRVFGLSQSEANQWANAVPNVLKISLSQARKKSAKLESLIQQSENNQRLFETAEKLEGLPRHISTHAAGVVISDQLLTNLIPLQMGNEDIPLTQFTMGDVETIGLLKMDFLGLRNLSILDDTLRYIKKMENKTIKISQIPLDDSTTLKLFQQGRTTGIFQFESAGIRNVLRKLGPTSIEDIAAVNALYRPGPMENIDLFIKRKKGIVPVEYPDLSLEPILKVTYGVMVYQEQVMQVASKMAGFTLGQADILRRAISKKKKSIIDQERKHFVRGSVEQGYAAETADRVYDYIERFANYGFNRSHAVAYSFIGYQMAYLKVHYPAPFFAALLHSVRHNPTKMKEYVAEAEHYKISVQPPDINSSEYSFTLKKEGILFGLNVIKGTRREFVAHILAERRQNGLYKSLDNFLLRIDRKWLKSDNILPFIYIGAFDQLEGNRRQMATDLEGMLANITISGGSIDLLEMLTLKEQPLADFTLEEKLAQEEKYLGLYVSGHPVEEFASLKLLKNISDINQVEPDKKTGILLYSKNLRNIRTKKGELMAFLEGNDATGDLSVTIFPRLYRQLKTQLEKGIVYFIEGKIERSSYNQELQMLAEVIQPAKELTTQISDKICYLKIPVSLSKSETSTRISKILESSKGTIPVILYDEKNEKTFKLEQKDWITDQSTQIADLKGLLGEKNVVVK